MKEMVRNLLLLAILSSMFLEEIAREKAKKMCHKFL
jgi:hypothetical protein